MNFGHSQRFEVARGESAGFGRIRGDILASARMSRRNFLMSGIAWSWKQISFVVVVVALTLTPGPVYGQSQAITATLSGTILDPTGQTVSGAKIILVSP